jgi:hypothetical protein
MGSSFLRMAAFLLAPIKALVLRRDILLESNELSNFRLKNQDNPGDAAKYCANSPETLNTH